MIKYSLTVFVLLLSLLLKSQVGFRLGISTGSAYNFPSKLIINQDGFTPIELTAKFKSEAFVMPWYWDIKGEVFWENNFIGLHFNHHKLILDNPTPEIQSFEISHGFNIVNAYFGRRFEQFYISGGGGISVSHPEGVVRGKWIANHHGIPLLSGFYDISSPNFEATIGKDWKLLKNLIAYSELKSTYCMGNIKTYDGSIDLVTFNVHLNVGLAYQFLVSK